MRYYLRLCFVYYRARWRIRRGRDPLVECGLISLPQFEEANVQRERRVNSL